MSTRKCPSGYEKEKRKKKERRRQREELIES